MSWIAAGIVGGSVLSGLIGAAGSQAAANTQAGAARRGQDINQSMFQQTQGNLDPYMQAGQMPLSQMSQGLQPGGQFNTMFGMDQFQASPAYQFNLQEGQKALDKAANARGGGNLYAPQTMKDLSTFSQGLASNEFQNAFQNYQTGTNNIWNRLATVAGGGQNAAAGLGGFATGFGNTQANLIGQQGNAVAGGQMGIANSLGGSVNNLTNFAMLNQLLSQQQQPSLGQEMVPGQYSTVNPQYG